MLDLQRLEDVLVLICASERFQHGIADIAEEFLAFLVLEVVPSKGRIDARLFSLLFLDVLDLAQNLQEKNVCKFSEYTLCAADPS
jgi:hypothetical protein